MRRHFGIVTSLMADHSNTSSSSTTLTRSIFSRGGGRRRRTGKPRTNPPRRRHLATSRCVRSKVLRYTYKNGPWLKDGPHLHPELAGSSRLQGAATRITLITNDDAFRPRPFKFSTLYNHSHPTSPAHPLLISTPNFR